MSTLTLTDLKPLAQKVASAMPDLTVDEAFEVGRLVNQANFGMTFAKVA